MHVCTCSLAYTHICIYTLTHDAHIFMHTQHVHIRVCSVRIYTIVLIRTHAHVHTNIHIIHPMHTPCTYTLVLAHTHTFTYTHTHTHTLTHTHTYTLTHTHTVVSPPVVIYMGEDKYESELQVAGHTQQSVIIRPHPHQQSVI